MPSTCASGTWQRLQLNQTNHIITLSMGTAQELHWEFSARASALAQSHLGMPAGACKGRAWLSNSSALRSAPLSGSSRAAFASDYVTMLEFNGAADATFSPLTQGPFET